MSNKEKYFNLQEYQKELEHNLNGLDYANDLKDGLEAFKCKTLAEVEAKLQDLTGFANHKMSASSMGLEDEYLDVLTYYGKIELGNYNEELTDVSEKFDKELKKKYTTYWGDADAEKIDQVKELVDEINKHKVGYSVSINRSGIMFFNETAWDNFRQEFRPRK